LVEKEDRMEDPKKWLGGFLNYVQGKIAKQVSGKKER